MVVCDRGGLLALSCGTEMAVIFQDTGKHSSQSGVRMEHPAQRAPGGHTEIEEPLYTQGLVPENSAPKAEQYL